MTAWLAALLIISASFGLPVTRGASNRISCCQVYCEKDRRRSEQASEPRKTIVPPAAALLAAALPFSLRTALLDRSLFQRPPPVVAFARL